MELIFLGITVILMTALGLVAYIVLMRNSFCMALLSSHPETQLDISPKELEILRISFVMFLLVLKSVAQAMKIGPNLNFTESTDTTNTNGLLKLSGPQFKMSMPLQFDQTVINKYEAAVDNLELGSRNIAPEQIALILSAASEPAILLLLAKITCPIRPLGAVNVRNRFENFDLEACRNIVFEPHSSSAYLKASLVPQAKKVKRGYEFDLVCDVISNESRTILFRQTFTMLQFARHRSDPEARDPMISNQTTEISKSDISHDSMQKSTFDLAFNEPSLWAAICKDYNPIHISQYAARCFGFRSKIAHGNHVVAKALVTMESAHSIQGNTPMWIEVDFRRPMQVPSTFAVIPAEKSKTSASSPDYSFHVLQKGKVCVDISLGAIHSTKNK